MQLIRFNDECVISRYTGEKDKWDNQQRETIYEGKCCYQEGNSVGYSRSIVTRTPTLFLPVNSDLIMINDRVEIVTEYGREISSTVKVIRDVKLSGFGSEITRIELKQAQGD